MDVCTPAEWDGDRWSYVDLELDIVRTADGAVIVVDEDEFDELVVAHVLPDKVVTAARGAAVEVRAALLSNDDLFGRRGWDWLARAKD